MRTLAATAFLFPVWLALPAFAQVSANPAIGKASERIQNIAPEEMWKRVTHCVFPTYPPLASQAQITGMVDIGLGISPEGSVADHHYRVLSGPPLLVQSAISAILQWKFQPNLVQGEATWSRVRALVRFNADGSTAIDLARAIRPDDFGDPGIPVTGSAESRVVSTIAVPRPTTAPACSSAQPWTGVQAQEVEAAVVGPGFYNNNYFGLSFHFPLAWRVADRETIDAMDSRMQKAAQTQFGSMPANVHVSSFPSSTLFFAFTDGPSDSPGNFVWIWTEKNPLISNTNQYFANTNFLTDKTADGTRGPEEVDINGSKFYRGDRWERVKGGSIYEVRLVTYTRDLILAIQVLADTAATAEQMVKDLEGLKIVPPT